MASTVLPNGIIIPEKYSRDWYNDLYHNWEELDNLLSASTPGDGTLTIQKNGATVGTFSANQATDETINLAVPTKTSDLTNDSGFITEDNTKIPLSGTNELAGSIVPATDNSYDFGSSTYKLRYIYANTAYVTALNINGVVAGDILTHNVDEFIPRSGGAVLSGIDFCRTVDNSYLSFRGGSSETNGGGVLLFGKDFASAAGVVEFVPRSSSTNQKDMVLYPDGTWRWNGSAVQIISDQRLKQQIAEIDDKLLDAWEDVELSQFKFNDAVDQKGGKARLHTGYIVQQISKACRSHDVDISAYGLFCHEEYSEETAEIEVEQKDGTKVKQHKVIREANEHYSLRYTEAYAVECKYLRRCIARLTSRIEELEKGNDAK